MFYSDAQTSAPGPLRVAAAATTAPLMLDETGKGKRIKITDTVFDPKAKPLAYGKSTKFGQPECTSRTTGITCTSTRSSHGFTVSIDKQRVF